MHVAKVDYLQLRVQFINLLFLYYLSSLLMGIK
jgi:hypothetical protein